MSTIPQILHPAWCDPHAHDYTGELDQWHRSAVHTVETVDDRPNDPDRVEVSVEQYSDRPHGVGDWHPHNATVLLHTRRPGGSDLTPHEARKVARLLLAGADIAESLAVTW